ncbi:MAG: PTS sugar transporter subunit IIC [Gemmatimonadales bacterium]
MTFVASLVPFALLGALLGLDVVSFPQAMLSRPIVAATLSGALAGHAERGLLAGAVLELFALETLPFGASRYPEWGSASVVGGALFAAHGSGGRGALALSVLSALFTASVSGWSMVAHRRLIVRWIQGMREALAGGSERAVSTLQLRGLLADFARAGVITAAALALFGPLVGAVLAALPMAAPSSRAAVAVLAAATAGAAVWNVVHTTRGAPWLLLGGVVVGTGLAFVT